MVVPGNAAADRPGRHTQQPQAGRKVLLTPQIERPADQTVIWRLASQVSGPDRILPATITFHSSADVAISGSPGLVATRAAKGDVHAGSGRNGGTTKNCRLPNLANQDRTEFRNRKVGGTISARGSIPDCGNPASCGLSPSYAVWPWEPNSSTAERARCSSAVRPVCCGHPR